jgi:hypothetical protein
MIPIFGDLSDEHLAQIAGFPTQPLLLCSGGGSSDLARAIYGLLTDLIEVLAGHAERSRPGRGRFRR